MGAAALAGWGFAMIGRALLILLAVGVVFALIRPAAYIYVWAENLRRGHQ